MGSGDGHEGMLDHGLRVFGISLGPAAIGGAWSTLGSDLPSGRGVAVRGRPCHAAGRYRSRPRSPASMVALAPRAASTIPIVSSDCSDVAALVLMIPAPGWGPARRPSRRTPASGGGVGAGRTVERANHLRPADLRHRMPEHVTTRGHRD